LLWPVNTGHKLQRLGNYLFPKNIGKIDAVFSPGVGPTSDFEYEFAKKGIKCFLADASVTTPAITHKNFIFTQKHIGKKTTENYMTLRQWVHNHYSVGNNAILQMDIEGGEYESITRTDQNTLCKFKVIIIEIHKLNILSSQEGLELGTILFYNLLNNFYVCHFHTNNYIRPIHYKGIIFPSDIELTLVRKDLCTSKTPVTELPNPLDIPSNPEKKDPSYYQNFLNGIIYS
jgi:hypothetical protein